MVDQGLYWSECAGKIPNKTREQANQQKQAMIRKGKRVSWRGRKLPLTVYKCRFCFHFHVGNDKLR